MGAGIHGCRDPLPIMNATCMTGELDSGVDDSILSHHKFIQGSSR